MIERRAWLAGAALAPLAAVPGCAFTPPQTRALRAARPAALPVAAELHAVPFFAGTAGHCGPAALAGVLGAIDRQVDPATIAAQVVLPARHGSLQIEMLAATRRHDALAVLLPGRLTALLHEVAGGRPVLVLQNLGLAWLPAWHYAVLVGYDLDRESLVLNSGAAQREVMPMRTFEHTWARAGHWAFVALAPGELAGSASEEAVTDASIAFERVAAPALAVRAYEAALVRWPQSLLLGMGLGNARYAARDFGGAARAFGQVATLHDSAAAWNNLALALVQSGEREAARAAAHRAVVRAEAQEPHWLPAARKTLQDLR